MCGIVGYTGKENAVKILLDGLDDLQYRGYDSSGIAVISGKDFSIIKTDKRVEQLKQIAKDEKIKGNTGIGHTRWATHGAPEIKNAHPHAQGSFCAVHNGIIENYALLKEKLKKEGAVFKSDTDSEVIPHLLNCFYNGNIKEAAVKTFNTLEGSFAVAALCREMPQTVIAAKKMSPLIIGLCETGNIIASDINAIIPYTNKIIYLEDEEIAIINSDSIEVFGFDGQAINKTVVNADYKLQRSEKNGFEHYMLKEIYEQPAVIKETFRQYIKNGEICFEDLKLNRESFSKFTKIHIVACGSAYYAGQAAAYAFEELTGIEVKTEVASEYRYKNNFIDSGTLVIGISQSGETADTLNALISAKKKGAYILSVVNARASSVSQVSNDTVYTPAGPEIAVATTKGFTSQLCVLYLLALYFSGGSKELLKELLTLEGKVQKILSNSKQIENIAESFADKKAAFFIGRNTDYAVAKEGALKLKEVAYINSQAYPAGELKHGTIALIEEGTLVFALCCNEALKEKTISNIKEVKARGAFVISISFCDETVKEESDETVVLPSTHKLFYPVLEVIPLQLYAYYTALARGCDIDKPRNLAKSVTVE